MFKFNLEPVLSLREKIEDSKKRELGEATIHQENVYKEKLSLEQKMHQALLEVKHPKQQTIDVASMKAYNHYSAYMEKSIQAKEEQLKEAKRLVDEKRQDLLEAVKDRKILENLKAIHKEAFIEEEKRDEQRIMDDMVTYRFGNKGRE